MKAGLCKGSRITLPGIDEGVFLEAGVKETLPNW